MKRDMLRAAVFAVVVVGVAQALPFAQQNAGMRGPAHSIEGAWIGTATIPGLPPTPSMDTFTSNTATPGREGSFLCTIPPFRLPNPENPIGWLTSTPSAHGNWLRVGKSKYDYTAWRIMMDQDGVPVGQARFSGTITRLSDEEYLGR